MRDALAGLHKSAKGKLTGWVKRSAAEMESTPQLLPPCRLSSLTCTEPLLLMLHHMAGVGHHGACNSTRTERPTFVGSGLPSPLCLAPIKLKFVCGQQGNTTTLGWGRAECAGASHLLAASLALRRCTCARLTCAPPAMQPLSLASSHTGQPSHHLTTQTSPCSCVHLC